MLLIVVVVVACCVINFVIQSIIQPKLVGHAVGMSDSITFLSLVIWAWILGPLGAVGRAWNSPSWVGVEKS